MKIRPMHPGEFLKTEFLVHHEQLNINLDRLAPDIVLVALERKDVDLGIANSLAHLTKMSIDFWLNIQAKFDEDIAEDKADDTLPVCETCNGTGNVIEKVETHALAILGVEDKVPYKRRCPVCRGSGRKYVPDNG